MHQIPPEIYPHSGVHMAWSRFSLALGKTDPTIRRGSDSKLHIMNLISMGDFGYSVFQDVHTQITELVYDVPD